MSISRALRKTFYIIRNPTTPPLKKWGVSFRTNQKIHLFTPIKSKPY